MINVQRNLLEYAMLHASFCGNLFILITGFLNLRCDCPQEESKLVTPPLLSLADVPNMLLKCIFRRGDCKRLKPTFLAFDHVIRELFGLPGKQVSALQSQDQFHKVCHPNAVFDLEIFQILF